jgi:arylsulfatase A-like enzyme
MHLPRRLATRLAVALGLIAVALSIAPRGASPRVERVILISIDTLRAGHLGAYGYARPTSPAIDALAARGVLFQNASTPSPWTYPAHASLFTGLYPGRHGLKNLDRFLPASLPTLASVLGRAGWTTAAVVNSEILGPRFGLDRGFREFLYVEQVAAQRAPTTRVVDQALEWAKRYRDRKLFLFVHTEDVSSDYASQPKWERQFVRPYSGPADGTTEQLVSVRQGKATLTAADARHLVDLYDAGIRQTDAEIGRLLDGLRASGVLEGSLILLTSDHGEEFLEHGGVLHGRTQFEEVVRVPLIVAGPGVAKGSRVPVPVSLIDVMPTLLATLGVTAPEALDGEDLTPLFSGRAAPRAEGRFLFGEADQNNPQLDITRAVRHGADKLHFDRMTHRASLYDLKADPAELRDLAADRPEVVRELRQHIDRFMRIQPLVGESIALTPAEIEKLRSLGYIIR